MYSVYTYPTCVCLSESRTQQPQRHTPPAAASWGERYNSNLRRRIDSPVECVSQSQKERETCTWLTFSHAEENARRILVGGYKVNGGGQAGMEWSMDYGGGHNKIKYQNAI